MSGPAWHVLSAASLLVVLVLAQAITATSRLDDGHSGLRYPLAGMLLLLVLGWLQLYWDVALWVRQDYSQPQPEHKWLAIGWRLVPRCPTVS